MSAIGRVGVTREGGLASDMVVFEFDEFHRYVPDEQLLKELIATHSTLHGSGEALAANCEPIDTLVLMSVLNLWNFGLSSCRMPLSLSQ